MKLPYALIVIALLCSLLCSTNAQTLKFNGGKYYLTSVSVAKDGDIANQYFKRGETATHWSTMIGVNQWPHLDDFAALHRWKESTKELIIGDVDMLVPNGKQPLPGNGVFQAFILAPDHSYCIGYLCRFKIKPGATGVMVYEFAMFIPVHNGEPLAEPFFKDREEITMKLLNLDVPIHHETSNK